MMDLVTTILTESDTHFNLRLMNADPDMRDELLAMRGGMKKRDAFMKASQGNVVFFETVAERLQKMKEWYPRAYGILNQMLPGLMLWPNDMAPAVLNLADSLVKGCLLPDDQRILALSVGV